MSTTRASILPGLLLLAACGGGGADGGGGPALNAFTGTITVSSARPAGVTTCQGAPAVVRFTAGGGEALPHDPTVAGGGCVQFVNDDAAPHQPAPRGVGCIGLAAPAPLGTGQSFTTGPLGSSAGATTCDWQDALNPPVAGGGGY